MPDNQLWSLSIVYMSLLFSGERRLPHGGYAVVCADWF